MSSHTIINFLYFLSGTCINESWIELTISFSRWFFIQQIWELMRKKPPDTLQCEKAVGISIPEDNTATPALPGSLWVWALLLLPSLLTLFFHASVLLLQFNSETCFRTDVLFVLSVLVQILNFLLKNLAWWFWLFLLSASLDRWSSCQWTLISIDFVKVP